MPTSARRAATPRPCPPTLLFRVSPTEFGTILHVSNLVKLIQTRSATRKSAKPGGDNSSSVSRFPARASSPRFCGVSRPVAGLLGTPGWPDDKGDDRAAEHYRRDDVEGEGVA